ncbi:UNVERIFIED_CONTAM: uncharacterized lipoprotein YddW (UPF0748 family) [Brevibacillus sp. OAP136]
MRFRNWIHICFLTLLLFAASVPALQPPPVQAAAPSAITLLLDGQPLASDVSPYILPGVNITMVPLRVISEGLGASVDWDPGSQTATISRQGTTILMTVNMLFAVVNNNSVSLDASAENKGGRIMVPVRFVSEQLGLTVDWDQASRTILLTSANGSVAGPPPDIINSGSESSGDTSNNNGSVHTEGSLRGVWISTVFNLDWPSTASVGNQQKQKQEYIQLLDELQSMGMNAAFVQVRPAADALYPSSLVPWSKFLTGTQGKNPGYDPLAFMIEETHKRGMEFHAWFNPFRANTDAKTDKLAANHLAKAHPDWIVNASNKLYINPGIPQARQEIIKDIMEVVTNYDIDGVHLDDYFYPSDGVFNDAATFKAYNSKKIANLADWRRDNINQFVSQLGASIHSAKPQVKFGISPFGVWRNIAKDPTGSDTKAGVTAYDNMYADVRTWIKQGWIDYVAPQLYWSLSFTPAQYDKLVAWWANEVNGTGVKLYIGHSPYKLGTAEAGWSNAQEIINQLIYNTQYPQVQGDIFFSAKDLRKNPLGIVQALRSYYGM